MVLAAEQHVDWIIDCIDYMRTHDLATIEARGRGGTAWVEHVNGIAAQTLYPRAIPGTSEPTSRESPRSSCRFWAFPTMRRAAMRWRPPGYAGFEVR